MRTVLLTEAAKAVGTKLSTFGFEGVTYRLENGQSVSVADNVAAAWIAADTNTMLKVER